MIKTDIKGQRTVALVNKRYTWIGRYKDIENISTDVRYIWMRRLDYLYFVSLDKASDGRENLLVFTDAFTKFTKAVPTKNQLAITVAKVLMNEWIFAYGRP